MDVSNIASAVIGMTSQQTRYDLGIRLLKQTIETQANSVLTLLETAAQPAPSRQSDHLGNNIDTTA